MSFVATETVSPSDAYDLATLGHEYGRWLAVLTRAIQLDCKHNGGSSAQDLASLGQFLADNLSNEMDCEAERIKRVEGLQ